MSAFPPHRTIASIPVSPDVALKLLSTYLEKTNTSPYLLPNAKLEPSGPAAGSSASSVTIHNLQRIEAGLKGEWLAPTLELEGGDVNAVAVEAAKKPEAQGEGEGWQDLDEYQREQSVEEGELGPRQSGVIDGGVPNLVSDTQQGENQEELDAPIAKKLKTEHTDVEPAQSTKTPKDKEARKREKAARNDKLKKEKEQKRKEDAAKSNKAA